MEKELGEETSPTTDRERIWAEVAIERMSRIRKLESLIKAHEEGRDKLVQRLATRERQIYELFDVIKHGDEEQQRWLKDTLVAHFYPEEKKP